MHEMGIAMQVIEIAKASIPADMENPKVECINLSVGKLAAVVSDSLKFCFEVATTDDAALSGAKLVIKEIPVVAICNDCGHRWTIEGPVFLCEKCNSGSVEIVSGQELDIDSIEVAD